MDKYSLQLKQWAQQRANVIRLSKKHKGVEIARMLKVSRQRISKIIRDHERAK